MESFNITSHSILKLLDTYGVLNLGDYCRAVFNSKIKLNDSPLNIQKRSLVDKSYLHQIRQFKITGNCYALLHII